MRVLFVVLALAACGAASSARQAGSNDKPSPSSAMTLATPAPSAVTTTSVATASPSPNPPSFTPPAPETLAPGGPSVKPGPNDGPPIDLPAPIEPEKHGVRFLSFPTVVRPGSTASVVVGTSGGATCTIALDGPGRVDLEPRRADRDGRVGWSWDVGPSAAGPRSVDVRCVSAKGEVATSRVSFEVR